MTNIPVIDFKNLPFDDNLNGEELNKWNKIGEEVYKACSAYGNNIQLTILIYIDSLFSGFFYIKNHGISKEDIDNQFNMVKFLSGL
jgi:hypothetical protein